MNTGTIKNLGVAVLGVAFAAASAGTASATDLSLDPASALGGAPVGQAAQLVPGGAQAAGATTGATRSVPAVTDKALPQVTENLALGKGDKESKADGLFGVLPLDGVPLNGLLAGLKG